jgi:PAS domain S-box-containing protein
MMIGRGILTRLYSGYLLVVVVFGLILPILLRVLSMTDARLSVAYQSILVSALILALLRAHTIIVSTLRSVGMVGEALEAAREGCFTQLATDTIPSELAPLAGSYNALVVALELQQGQLRAELGRTALLTRLSIELRESFEPATIVRDILRAIVSNTDADSANIMLLAPDGAIALAFQILNGELCEIQPQQSRQILERGLAGWVLRNGRNVVLSDVARDDRWVPIDGQQVGSAMTLALTQGRMTFGALTIMHAARDRFTSQDLLLLEGVAAQAGVALNAAYRHNEERRYRKQALLLFSMSQFLTAQRSAADLANELLEKCESVFEAGHAALYLLEHEAAEPTLFGSRSDAGHLGGVWPSACDVRLAEAAARAWRGQSPITEALFERGAAADSGATDPRQLSSLAHAADLMYVALPLLHNGAVIGVLVLIRRAPGAAVFSARMWSMLTTFTNVAAAAFANLQLVDRLQARAQELERLVDERTHQLQRSRDLLRVIFDHLPDGLVLMDADTHILAANRAFARNVLGIRPQSIVSRTYQSVVDELERSSYLRIEPHHSDSGARRVVCTDLVGQQRWFEIERYAFEDGAQAIERWRDITQQEQLLRRLLLHEQLTMIGHLAASIAHEVGNPLQSVRSCLELCREDVQPDSDTEEYLVLAQDELDRVSQALDRLREFYRPPLLEWAPVDLNDLINQIGKVSAQQMLRSSIQLDLYLSPGIPLVHGQPDALRQVLLGLLFHAQQSMRGAGSIRITTYADTRQRMSCFTIVDTSGGISPERLSTIFEPHHRNWSQQAGLGVYLSKQVVQQHAGEIDISSQLGIGTTVVVGIPWYEEQYAKSHNTHS